MDFRDLCAETFHILDKETEARGDKGLIVGRTAWACSVSFWNRIQCFLYYILGEYWVR